MLQALLLRNKQCFVAIHQAGLASASKTVGISLHRAICAVQALMAQWTRDVPHRTNACDARHKIGHNIGHNELFSPCLQMSHHELATPTTKSVRRARDDTLRGIWSSISAMIYKSFLASLQARDDASKSTFREQVSNLKGAPHIQNRDITAC
jgi:hypothetical protein